MTTTEESQRSRKRLSADEKESLLELYHQDVTVREIASRYEVTAAVIYSTASRAGIHRQHALTEKEKKTILSLRTRKRLSQREIGRRVGTSPTSVRRVLHSSAREERP